MEQNTDEKHREIVRTETFVSSSSDLVNSPRKSIDPQAEIAEPHLLQENSFPHHSIVTSARLSNGTQSHFRKSTTVHNRRSIIFDKKQTLPSTFRHSVVHDSDEKEPMNTGHPSNVIMEPKPTNFTTPDLLNLLADDEYIPGGFANLDHELEKELLNDFVDEFDELTIRRKQQISSIHSVDLTSTTRSPIELWQKARLLIALHLYQIQNKALHPLDDTLDTSVTKHSADDKLDELEKLLKVKENRDEQKVIFGLSLVQKYSLDRNREYRCVDFYDVEQGYILLCHVTNSDHANCTALAIYPIDKKSFHPNPPVEFECPNQLNFLICVPIFRIILAFANLKSKKSLMLLLGDASRKGMFLSKQEIPEQIYSVLYIHEANLLFIGCIGRVLLYNTQPLQYTSQPLFLSELGPFPFQNTEPIIHLCQIFHQQSIGILSARYFLLWQYAPTAHCLMKFCNPHRYDFVRCHYNWKYDYIILAFLDGLILIYQLKQMKQIRRYQQYHWQTITDLKNSQDGKLLLSASLDQMIHVWNLDTLQHLYQYDTKEEVFQLDTIEENLYLYRTSKSLVLFQLNLRTILFAITNNKVISLKLFIDTSRTARLIALLEDYSSILISPVSGSCLTSIPNLSKNPIKQILHDISRSTIYSLQFNGEILLYHAHHNPCDAEYRIRTKSPSYTITCMTLINPMRTHLVSINTMQISEEKSLEKQAIFFGHQNGYISLFQGELFNMPPVLAHQTAILCLETSRASMDKSNLFFTNCEVLLSCSIDRQIYLWDLVFNQNDQSIELVHLLTVEQEKNISFQSIKYLLMIDQFILANYSDQNYLHVWQILNISIRLNDYDQWGIVEHPTKGKSHLGQIQAISAASKLKLFASSGTEGSIKIWDNTNSLLREISLDQTLCAMEFLPSNGELLIAYQNNIHLILPEHYLTDAKQFQSKQQTIWEIIAEESRLNVPALFHLPYESLPVFEYKLKTHHEKKRLQRFERQLAGRYAVIDSDHSESDLDTSSSSKTDRLSVVSDDPNWSNLADEVKDILRLKKSQIRRDHK